MDDIYIKWKTMWDAKEYTTQLFFLFNAIVAFVIMYKPMQANSEATAVKRGITFAVGLGYLIIVIVGYLQLVPTFSPYE